MAGRARGLAIRGKGYADLPPFEPLRKPGDIKQPNPVIGVATVYDVKPDVSRVELDDIFKELNTGLVNDAKLQRMAESLKSMCSTPDRAMEAVQKVYEYCLLNKMNAHYGALLCKYIGNLQAGSVKFKFALFKVLQVDYEDRKRKYSNLDQFLNIVVVLCEIYHHLRINDGTCYSTLAVPIIEYLGMLVDGGSEKEIETFVEQIMKCGKSLQNQEPINFESLVFKIRKQITGISSISSRSMLLLTFEKILNSWDPLSESASNFYNAICKQITSSCE